MIAPLAHPRIITSPSLMKTAFFYQEAINGKRVAIVIDRFGETLPPSTMTGIQHPSSRKRSATRALLQPPQLLLRVVVGPNASGPLSALHRPSRVKHLGGGVPGFPSAKSIPRSWGFKGLPQLLRKYSLQRYSEFLSIVSYSSSISQALLCLKGQGSHSIQSSA